MEETVIGSEIVVENPTNEMAESKKTVVVDKSATVIKKSKKGIKKSRRIKKSEKSLDIINCNVGQRILVCFPGVDQIREYLIWEFSIGKDYVCLLGVDGQKFWYKCSSISNLYELNGSYVDMYELLTHFDISVEDLSTQILNARKHKSFKIFYSNVKNIVEQLKILIDVIKNQNDFHIKESDVKRIKTPEAIKMIADKLVESSNK